MQKRLYGDRFSVTAEPIFVKRYMKAIANRGFEKKKLDTRFDTHRIKTGVQLWSRRQDLNLRHLGPKRTYEGTFRRKWIFPPLSTWKTALFGTLISTVSECSETVGGLLCGQQQFPQNNTHYTPLVIMREAIAFYTVIITLNNP